MNTFQGTTEPDNCRQPFLQLSPALMVFATAAFLMAAYNATFWKQALEIFAGLPSALTLYGIALYCLTVAYLLLFANRWLLKPFLIFNLILCAVTSYYQDRLGVIIDREMIQNAATTTISESRHLITGPFVLHVFVWGMLPAAIVVMIKVKRDGLVVTTVVNVICFVMALFVCCGILAMNYKAYSSVLHENRDFMDKYQPGAPLAATIGYLRMMTKVHNIEVQSIGRDATQGAFLSAVEKPILTVLIVGETVRDANFGLSGYARDTTPELAQRNITHFAGVESCGTATAVSMPCMFSKFTRRQYSHKLGLANENLLDILGHAGFATQWWDVNTGDKRIADRTVFRSFYNADDPDFCAEGECTDGIFLKHLAQKAALITEDTVLVLHQIGNHGPAYYLRYPVGFAPFMPDCRSADFSSCSEQEIVNAYDNAIAYTDQQLALTIDLLGSLEHLNASLIYVSDHGESLGENGLYLHGAPYWIAPEEQKTVPMFIWMSEGFQQGLGVTHSCLLPWTEQRLSHDHFFHSVLGLLDVITSERDPNLDIFNTCRTQST